MAGQVRSRSSTYGAGAATLPLAEARRGPGDLVLALPKAGIAIVARFNPAIDWRGYVHHGFVFHNFTLPRAKPGPRPKWG